MSEENTYQNFRQALRVLNLPEKSVKYREKLYSALCNLGWKNADGTQAITFSFRAAGGEVAGLTDQGEDYLDYYCSGQEGCLAEDIEQDLNQQGWYVCSFDEALAIQAPEEKKLWLIKYRTPILLKQQNKKILFERSKGKTEFIIAIEGEEQDQTLEVEIDLNSGESKNPSVKLPPIKDNEDFSDYPFEVPRYNEEQKSGWQDILKIADK